MDVNGRTKIEKPHSILKSHRALLCAHFICLFNVAFTVCFLHGLDRTCVIMFKCRAVAHGGTSSVCSKRAVVLAY